MKFVWDREKNKKLAKERGITFEEIVIQIQQDRILDIIPGKGIYKHQSQFIVEVRSYVHIVPFVEKENELFLITIIPSRKMTKKYLAGDADR